MQHRLATLATTAIAALALAACDGATVLEPAGGGARFTDNQCPPGEVCWEEPPGDTTSVPMVAEFRRFSTAYGNYDATWKYVRMYAVSESYRFVQTTTLDATFRHYRYGCLPSTSTVPQVSHVTKTGAWSPVKLEADYYSQYSRNSYQTFQVNSIHSFTPIPNATGGGTFNTAFRGCY